MKPISFSDKQAPLKRLTLEETAPKLASFLYKTFPAHKKISKLIYETCCLFGGYTELKFKREKGVSFNPRAARIPLIIKQIIKDPSLPILLASMLSTTQTTPRMNYSADRLLPEEESLIKDSWNLYLEVQALHSFLIGGQKVDLKKPSKEVSIISIANFIDRFRHAHLVNKGEIQSCLNIYDRYFLLIPPDLNHIALSFETWHKRAQILLKSSGN